MAWLSDFLKSVPVVRNVYDVVETGATFVDGNLRKIPIVKTVYNPASDLVKRTATLIDGEMNFDITVRGPKQIRSINELKAGDILLKQGAYRSSADTVSYGIQAGQMAFNSSGHKYFNAGLLTHAALYVGNYEVVECIGEGVTKNRLDIGYNRDFTWYVIRCKNERVSAKAKGVALDANDAIPKIEYAAFGALKSGLVGDITMSEYTGDDPTSRDRWRIEHNKKTSMYCSELVMYCYNCACDHLKIPRYSNKAQHSISPEELYVMMRDDHAHFEYIGEMHQGVR